MNEQSASSERSRVTYYFVVFCTITLLYYEVSLIGVLLFLGLFFSKILVHMGIIGIVLLFGAAFYANKTAKNLLIVYPDYYSRSYLENGQERSVFISTGIVALFVTFLSFSSADSDFLFPFLLTPLITASAGLVILQVAYKNVPEEETEDLEDDDEPEVEPYTKSVMPTGDEDSLIRFTYHGQAAWISDLAKESFTALKDAEPSYEGLWIGGGFFNHREGNLISIAPPGTGKGAALIIPNLLWQRNYRHSLVVFDPKGTNACITARFQKETGHRVIIIDPTGLQQMNNARHGIPASCFNPLDHIQNDLFNGTAQIANLLLPDDPHGEKFWNQDARNLIQSILLHIMTSPEYEGERNLITLHQIIIAGSFAKIFESMIRNKLVLNGIIRDAAMGFSNMLSTSEKTFSSIRSVASASIKWLSNPSLQEVLKKSDFSPDDLENGGITLYLCQPIQNKEGFATFSRLIIGSCLRSNSKPAARPKAWVYYLLDEFPTMGIFPEVIEALAYSREYRMRIWIFAQSLSQLDIIYKAEGRHQILGNARIFQAFSVTDHITQEYVSKRIGNKTEVSYSSTNSSSSNAGSSKSANGYGDGSRTNSTGSSSSVSQNINYHGMPLITPDQVEYDPNIITLTEWGPMRLVRWQYWENPIDPQDYPLEEYYYKILNDGRADPNPNFAQDDFDVNTNSDPAGEETDLPPTDNLS